LSQKLYMLAESALQRKNANREVWDSDCHLQFATKNIRVERQRRNMSESYSNAAKVLSTLPYR
jgi:hypothetical protein